MNQENETKKLPNQQLYTVKQIAEILQVKPNYIYLLCRLNQIPHINLAPLGSQRPMYRFNLQDVLNHWKQNETDATKN